MPQQSISITAQEHANALSAIGEYNGLQVTEVGVYNEGMLVAYDEVRLVVDGMELKVRSAPEKDNAMRDMINKRMADFVKFGPQGVTSIPELEEVDGPA